MILLQLFMTLLLSSAFAGAPSTKSCSYYQDLEKIYQCGEDGYLLKFGHRLCQRYLDAEPRLSAGIKKFFPQIRYCLQKALSDEHNNWNLFDCQDLREKAIASHVPCYRTTGFCELSLREKVEIMKITSTELFHKDVLLLAKEVESECLGL